MVQVIFNMGEPEASEALRKYGFADGRVALRNLKALSESPLKDYLDEILAFAIDSPSPDGALNNLENITREAPEKHFAGFTADPTNIWRLITICGSSSFLSNIMLNHPEFFEWVFKGGFNEVKDDSIFKKELTDSVRGLNTLDEAARALRIYKKKEYLRIGGKDLLGISTVDEVTREIADLASACLDAAVEFSLSELKRAYGAPLYTDYDGNVKEAEFTVIGLGKLGGRELNFSSDIDIIYIYSSDKGDTAGIEGRAETRISLHAFFVKLSTHVNRLISAVTGDGFVFRVDLDLRPEGRSGDMANSLRSAEIYYESWGQTWERAAMIKARPVAGSLELGNEFLSMIRPFVYRRYLDFTALEEIKSMKEKIDLSLLRRNPDAVDVKLGEGGIREIEFFCQALQLIHAGKDPDLRERTTLKAIEKLKSRGFLKEGQAEVLRDGYVFLRNLEHRIQIVEGRQSQAIPARAEELERLARMMGFKDRDGRKAGEFFWAEYKEKTASVHEVYRSLFYRSEEEVIDIPEGILHLLSPDCGEEESLSILSTLGFKDTGTAFKNLGLLRGGPAVIRLGSRAKVLFEKLAPRFLANAVSSPDPDRSLSHLERFIASIGARNTFYSLLSENPKILEELMKLFGTSLFLSRDIIERPESLDILLSKDLATPYKRREEFFEIIGQLNGITDYEEKLDTLRRFKSQEVFRIGINDIIGNLNCRMVSIQLTFLAEACLQAAVNIAKTELAARFGEPEAASFAVIGLGKLGGRELIYGSDLDIIFVYSDEEGRTTTGPRQISSHEYFVKLGQRIITALTLRTKEGFVFNVDTRLRPSGSSGPLVVSKEALLKYHREKTQVWEKQAFVKARAAGGDAAFGTALLKELAEIVYSRGLSGEDADEMLRIRKRMEVEIAKEDSSRYNIKTGKGGIVDIEFLTQALQLCFGRETRSLRTPFTLKAILRLYREGLIPEQECRFLKEAYSFLRLLEMRLRVVHDRPEGYLVRGSEELKTLAKRAGYAGPSPEDGLLDDYLGYSARVREIYLKTLEGIKGNA